MNLHSLTSRLSLVSVLALACISLACGGGGGASPTAPEAAPSSTQVELGSFRLVNDARTEHQVDPLLELRETLAEVAREHSRQMRDQGFFAHRDPQGRTVRDRLAEAGVFYSVAGENLARTDNIANPAAWAHEQLMQSDTHRPNILGRDYQVIGVGVAKDGNSYWITQVFVGL